MKLRFVVLFTVCIAVIWYFSTQGGYNEYKMITPGGTITLHLQKAVSTLERQRGFMFSNYLPKRHGMLFINHEPEFSKFWMHNTWLPLDILFLDNNGVVFQIHKAATPLNKTVLKAGALTKYVIEINAGESEAIGITEGSRLIGGINKKI